MTASREHVTSRNDAPIRATSGVWRDERSQVTPQMITITRPLPRQIIEEYITRALDMAILRQDQDGWFVEIPGIDGVWAKAKSPHEAFHELGDVLFEWLVLKLEHRDGDIPVIEQLDLNTL